MEFGKRTVLVFNLYTESAKPCYWDCMAREKTKIYTILSLCLEKAPKWRNSSYTQLSGQTPELTI